MILKYFYSLFVAPLLLFGNSEPKAVILNAELANSKVYKKEDLQATLQLVNQTSKDVLIYKYANFNYAPKCLEIQCFSNYYFVIQKKVNGNYSNQEEIANISEVPIYDSLGNSLDTTFNILKVGDSTTQGFNLLGYYRLQKGDYRVKFYYRIPEQNKQLPRVISSTWLLFEVKSENVEYMY